MLPLDLNDDLFKHTELDGRITGLNLALANPDRNILIPEIQTFWIAELHGRKHNLLIKVFLQGIKDGIRVGMSFFGHDTYHWRESSRVHLDIIKPIEKENAKKKKGKNL